MIHNGIFTISLDFELHWGGFEKWNIEEKKQYFLNTRKLIPTLLKVFETSGIHTTWATVGLLMHESKPELELNLPDQKPSYLNTELSPYQFIVEHLGENEMEDPYHYAHSIINQIVKTQGQELSSHSFAHYYCNEPGQTPAQFDADAKAWNRAGEKYDVKASSLVFPRNQFNEHYLKICNQNGIRIVRTNPKDWWWEINSTQNESKWKRLNRGLDAYFDVGGKTSYKLEEVKSEEGVWLLPASRLLRPYNPREFFLNDLKINKIKKEMTLAAKNNECYHLWWHPHNFGNFPKENMDGLVKVLNHYHFLNKKYGMISLNMQEMADLLSSKQNIKN